MAFFSVVYRRENNARANGSRSILNGLCTKHTLGHV